MPGNRLAIGNVIAEGFTACGNLIVFVPILPFFLWSAIPGLFTVRLSSFLQWSGPIPKSAYFDPVYLFISFFVTPLLLGVTILMIYEVTQGKTPNWVSSFWAALRRYPALFIINLILNGPAVLLIALLVPYYIVDVSAGVFLLLVLGMAVYLRFMFAYQMTMLQGEGSITSIIISWNTTQGNWGRLLALEFILILLSIPIKFLGPLEGAVEWPWFTIETAIVTCAYAQLMGGTSRSWIRIN